jgi:hypothetical protein
MIEYGHTVFIVCGYGSTILDEAATQIAVSVLVSKKKRCELQKI